MVEICRTIIASVNAEFMSPIRLRKKGCARTREEQAQRDEIDNEHGVELHKKKHDNDTENGQDDKDKDDKALELLCEFSCWLAVFPIAVKFFLRPDTRKGWADRYVMQSVHSSLSCHYDSTFHHSNKQCDLFEEAL
jgi:hypothetical protein